MVRYNREPAWDVFWSKNKISERFLIYQGSIVAMAAAINILKLLLLKNYTLIAVLFILAKSKQSFRDYY
jgi:hypothetical protein